MKLPRDLAGSEVAKRLESHYGYRRGGRAGGR